MALHDFKSQRLFVTEALSHDTQIEATREQANYLLNVLRMGDSDSILVFNGQDGEWLAHITVQGRKKCSLVCVEQTRAQPDASSLIYCFAPLKQARLDYMAQKAVEMGAGVLQPVLTQHTQVRNLNMDRLHKNAIEAMEQCGILTLPETRDMVSLRDLPDALSENTQIIFCDEAANNRNAEDRLTDLKSKRLALLIGPEGGFSDDERAFLNSLPNVTTLGLGPRILRADTAAVAALAILQSSIGDWYPRS